MKAYPCLKIAALTLFTALVGTTVSRGQFVSTPVTVNEGGVGANEIVYVGSSTIGNDVGVYAGALDIALDGKTTLGFCIDPWDWSGNGNLAYQTALLANAPGTSAIDGATMGATTALQIEQLWYQYYSPTMSNSTAAGLQIAIWDLVGASVSAATGGASWFKLDSSNDYGAAADIAWVDSHTNATAANLTGLTGPGQAYVVATSAIPPAITSSLTATANLNEPFSYAIATAGIPTSYAASGLPAGLSISSSTGLISGTPSAVGTFQVKLTASNSSTSDSATLSLTVAQTYTLSITGSPSAGGTFSGGGTYTAGTTVTISEAANSSYRAAGWGGPSSGSTASSSSSTTTIVMSANRTLAADFVQQGTLSVASGTGGTATGGGTYDVGSTVNITATPNANYTFNDWSGGSAANTSSSATTVTIAAGNSTVTANFSAIPHPPTAALTAAATAYTGSPFNVTSTASAQDNNLTLHSIEWMSPSGTWTVSSTTASGSSDNRNLGISFPSTGVWTMRAGASVDNGNTWVYSPTTQVTVSNGTTSYTLETMAVPTAAMLNWYAASPVSQKTYQVQHLNP